MSKISKYNYYTDTLLGCCDPKESVQDVKKATAYNINYMLCRTQRMFQYKNLPDTLPAKNLELMLQTGGYSIVTKVNDKLYCFTGGLGGIPNEYNEPTLAIVANPYLKFNKELEIDKECVVVRNDTLKLGMLPLFKPYAFLLAENSLSMRVANVNTRMISLLSASDDRTKKSAELYLKNIEDGKLGVVGESAFLEGIRVHALSNSSMSYLTQLIEYHQYIKATWYNEIGISSNYNMKRENLNEAETKMNDDLLIPLIDDMYEQRKIGVDKINQMYGTNIEVELNSVWKKKIELNDISTDELEPEEPEPLEIEEPDTLDIEEPQEPTETPSDTLQDEEQEEVIEDATQETEVIEEVLDRLDSIEETVEEIASEVLEDDRLLDET